ncbi:PIG-L family deacetylase [Telmatocola sphagniphila]|uniref:PIG-L family deacetylase n=1 Tax=Telmatocola sphagniphila TaxID=1123043 RepID=A0A8E6B7E5_9BACT|nr:PIG-L family deacetylase [Telmatocola sphagniphila]QVL32649.1 PIG-L family deacetylase [Telmatocola sphagniphila]
MSDSAKPDSYDVLAVAPHPDDLEILCGGTLAKLVKQGYKVGIIDLTSGEPTPRGSLEIRAREAEKAREILNVPMRINLDLPNRILMDEPANRFKLATLFRRYRPQIVIGSAGRTPAASPDHHQGHLLIEAARFYSQLTKWDDQFEGTAPYRVPHLVYAPFPFEAEQRSWQGTFIIDISDTFEQKMQAIQTYESQFDLGRFEKVAHFIRCVNGATGARCGYMYGEQFALPTSVGSTDLFTLVNGSKSLLSANIQPGKDHLPMG